MIWEELEPLIADLQNREVSVMNKIEELVNQNSKLPSIPLSFANAKDLIANTPYNVVVCGEVKKGKSSLLNAIIGQEILPVNNEIATSQVFRISNSNRESFELVFTDGSRQPISRSELSRYGSQVDANLNGEPVFQNRALSYIQVNIPIAFLPKGVSLVDTPGLGALYKSHEWITKNYVRNANAIIFVLDPERPIEDQEKKFILRALDVTEDIIFVMTKIDLYKPEDWNLIIQRNQSLLADIYATKGAVMPNIMPVSSLGLMKASTGKVSALKAINLKNSRFPEVKKELIKMMFRGVGILRTGLALKEAADQTKKACDVIDNMLKVCTEDNFKEQEEINARKLRQCEFLRDDWGTQSRKRQQVIQKISDICGGVRNQVKQVVASNGSISMEYEAKINNLRDMDEIRKFAKAMSQEIVNDVSSQWQSIALGAESQVAMVLSSVSSQIGNIGITSVGSSQKSLDVRELSAMEKINCWRGAAVFGAIGTGLSAAIGAFAVPVIGPVIGVALATISWLFGHGKSQSDEISKNKQNFQEKLYELLSELSNRLLNVQKGCTYSVVDGFTKELNDNAQTAIQSIFNSNLSLIEREIRDIERQAREDVETRKRDAKIWNDCKRDWDVVTSEVQQAKELQDSISRALIS